jgi:preprotein translocase subunit YajC
MNSVVFSLLMGGFGQGGGGAEGGSQSFITTLIPFALIIGIFYFLIIRPQNKKQKETQRMLSAIKKGDRVVTIGGIHGVVQSVKESSVIIKVDDNVKIEFSRSAVSTVNPDAKAEKTEKIEEKPAEDKESTGSKPAESEEKGE